MYMYMYMYFMCNLPAKWETWVHSLGWEDSPGGGHGNPLQYSCLENPHGQRSLAGYSPWGRNESDTTEQQSTTHIMCCPNPLSVVPGIKANACPLQYMIRHTKQTYLNQTLENQELDCADEELVSILICVSGFMFPTSLPSF